MTTCISSYSQFPNEGEYIIDPQEQFVVNNVSDCVGYKNIDLVEGSNTQLSITGNVKELIKLNDLNFIEETELVKKPMVWWSSYTDS